METIGVERFPRIVIQYCSKCKWQYRAVWYLQEILQTFGDQVKDISLQPIVEVPGTFVVLLQSSATAKADILYKRKSKKFAEEQKEDYYYDGFPDSKFLKLLIRNKISPESSLGHIDKYDTLGLTGSSEAAESAESAPDSTSNGGEQCEQCAHEA